MIEKVFVSIGADEEMIKKIRNSALTEDNMIEFIGILEQKGINLVGEYSRLLAEVNYIGVSYILNYFFSKLNLKELILQIIQT